MTWFKYINGIFLLIRQISSKYFRFIYNIIIFNDTFCLNICLLYDFLTNRKTIIIYFVKGGTLSIIYIYIFPSVMSYKD